MRRAIKKRNPSTILVSGIILLLIGAVALRPLAAFALTGPYPGSDVLGQTDFVTASIGTTATTLQNPWGSTQIDTTQHRLFVADTYNNRVLVYTLDGNNNLTNHTASYVLGQNDFTSSTAGTAATQLTNPTGLAYDANHNRLFVTSEYDVSVFNLSGGITNGMAATYELGQPSGFGGTSTTTDQATTNGVYNGIAYNPNNDTLFVMDYYRILVFNVSPSTITSGENASHILGQASYTASVTGTGQNTFNSFEYSSVAFDATRNLLYVSDSYNNRILVFNLANGLTDNMNASYVLGQANFTTNNSGSTQATMNSPAGLGIDTVSNQLFVDDSNDNCRVLVFNLAGGITNGMNASAVLGQPDFTTNTCSTSTATQTGMSEGYSENIAFDASTGRLYLPQYQYSRVLIYNFAHITNPSLASGVLGSAYSQSLTTTGSQGTVTYAVTGGTLPPGLTLNPLTGTITGTPTTAGHYSFEVSVTDAFGAAGSFTEDPNYTIIVANPAVTGPQSPDTGYGIHSQPSRLGDVVAGLAIVCVMSGVVLAIRSRSQKVHADKSTKKLL